MKFYPAEVGGKKVKQLVQMPFQFNLTKSSNPTHAGDYVDMDLSLLGMWHQMGNFAKGIVARDGDHVRSTR